MTVLLHKSRLVLADRLADAGLWLMAAIHALIALSFLIVLAGLSPARAQEPATCTGDNLLTKYEKDDPTGYARLRAEADAVPNGKAIFWKVEKDGKPASWLLGTMHVTDPRVLAMPDAARTAYGEAAAAFVQQGSPTARPSSFPRAVHADDDHSCAGDDDHAEKLAVAGGRQCHKCVVLD